MEIKTRINNAKAAASLLAFSLLFGGMHSAQATLLDISQKPLVLSDSVAPNLILTLDESGSMRWAFVPDDINGVHESRRAKSAAFNPMYYDPAVTYQMPIKYNADGSVASIGYSTAFTEAWNNGFVANTSTGSLNLTTGYKVSWSYDPTGTLGTAYGYTSTNSTANKLASNPTADFAGSASISNNNGKATVVKGDITFVITRTGTSTCTATATLSGVTLSNPTCSGSSGTYTATLAQVAVPAYYYVYDTTQSGCTKVKTDDNCYRLVFVTATSGQPRSADTESGLDERKNFSIWYSFYRNRALATLSAANLAFTSLPSSIRMTWQTLNNCKTFTGSSDCGTNYFRRFTDHHRGNFFNWLPTINFSTTTYLLQATDRAGKFLASEEPWYYDPNPLNSTGGRASSVTSPVYACRPSFHVLMTDGMWNSAMTVDTDDNAAIASLPDGTAYSPRAPFKDPTKNTLADLAFKYWSTDARPNLKNDLKPLIAATNNDAAARYWDPRNNPATWQHMVNYTVGLGLGNALTNANVPWTGETYAGAGYEAIMAGTANWPAASSGSDNNVYDLWHMAINSRGEFFNADSPDKVVDAFTQILNRIGNYTTSASRPAVTAAQVDGSNSYEVYETEFSSDDWSGDLKKYSLDSKGARKQAWSAKSKLNGERAVKMAAASGKQFQEFNWTNLDTTQKAYFNINPDSTSNATDSKGEARVNYIRGNRSNEGTTSGTFRTRSSVLGDIVNSAPVIVKDAQYLAYLADKIDGTSGDYYKFQQQVSARKEMIYVGANDGMLHGFNASTGDEELAFVPKAVLPNLYRLTGQNYQSGGHRYYVDGTPVVTDVYFGNAWHTVLIGSLRGGGRALFALDVTDPDNIKPLWEFTHDDLGFTFPQPVVARLHTGKWAVVTGNGYGNQSGATADKAALFVIDVETGALVREVVVEGDTAKANGLSAVRLADNDSDGIADYAYAGDLQGNLWRFDLFKATNTTTPASGNPFAPSVIGTAVATDIVASYGAKPLFKAADAAGAVQPITAPPSLIRHPSQKGYLVIFGTGKYFEDSDGNVNTTLGHSVYAIWDRKTKAENTSTSTPPTITRSNLLEQQIQQQLTTNISGVTNESRTITQNAPKWYKDNATADLNDSDVNHWGWRLDLQIGSTKAGEMMINQMVARGQALIFSTLTPNDDPCKDGVEAWLYGINSSSGGRTTFSVFDMDGNGDVNSGDTYNNTVISSRKLSSSSGFNLSGNTLFSTGESIVVDYGPTSSGRQSWQVIPKRSE